MATGEGLLGGDAPSEPTALGSEPANAGPHTTSALKLDATIFVSLSTRRPRQPRSVLGMLPERAGASPAPPVALRHPCARQLTACGVRAAADRPHGAPRHDGAQPAEREGGGRAADQALQRYLLAGPDHPPPRAPCPALPSPVPPGACSQQPVGRRSHRLFR